MSALVSQIFESVCAPPPSLACRLEDATPERLSAYQRENRGQEDEKYDYSRDYWGRERKPPFFSPHNRFYTTISVVAVLGGYYFYINHIETVPLTGLLYI